MTDTGPSLPSRTQGAPLITNAAHEVLNTYLSSLASRVVEEARREQLPTETGAIDTSDIENAIRRLKARGDLFPTVRRRWLRWTIVAVSAFGVLAIIAALFATVELGDGTSGPGVILADGGSGSGSSLFVLVPGALLIILGVGTIVLMLLRRSSTAGPKQFQDDSASTKFVTRMKEIEDAARARVRLAAGPTKSESVTLNYLLRSLVGTGVWSSEDLLEYRRLLAIRNSLVHGDEGPLSRKSAKKLLRRADYLLSLELRDLNGSPQSHLPTGQ